MRLEVPNELNECACICVWQDLQASNQPFDTLFISEHDRKLVEKASEVTLVFDAAQKVIFIGASSDYMLDSVKVRLTTLLQDHLADKNQAVAHAFFGQLDGRWNVEFRSILHANPQIARSILWDPWQLSYTGYDLCIVRTCSQKADADHEWHSVFQGQQPYYQARIFKGLNLPSRLGTMSQPQNPIAKWLTGVVNLEAASPKPNTLLLTGKALLDIDISDGDKTIVNEEETVSRLDVSTLPAGDEGEDLILFEINELAMSEAPEPNLLDQSDDELMDQPTLQRAMRPATRTILVPKPGLIAQPMAVGPVNKETVPLGEFGQFITTVKHMMRPFQRRRGIIGLRFEIGRYFVSGVDGEATSSSHVPGVSVGRRFRARNGHQSIDTAREDLQGHSYFFTKVLTYWGNDIDFMRCMKMPGTSENMWNPVKRTTFLDFRFMPGADQGEELANMDYIPRMSLEVDCEDFSWTVREWDNTRGKMYVHCLDQNWDLDAEVTHDRSYELNSQYQSFAQGLIESLSIDSPEIEFQHAFDRAPIANRPVPVGITNVRVRQVARLKHQDGKTFLDLTRVMSTKTLHRGEKIWRLSYFANENLPGRYATRPGSLSQWYQASISSVRLEELLKLNESLIPGDEAGWTVEQLEDEGVLSDIYCRAIDVVSKIDGVGVTCDDGRYKQTQQPVPSHREQGTAKSYRF